ncbi:MAG: hypothetical protein AAGA23_08720 [Pseudomonadota bacterium]
MKFSARSITGTALAAALATMVAGCASAPAVSEADAQAQAENRKPVATNTRAYCRDDLERTGTNNVASAVRQSASSARRC